jgi:hypothetical protein
LKWAIQVSDAQAAHGATKDEDGLDHDCDGDGRSGRAREREREDVGGGVGLEERRKLGGGDHDLSIRKAWHKETYQ